MSNNENIESMVKFLDGLLDPVHPAFDSIDDNKKIKEIKEFLIQIGDDDGLL